MTLRFFATRSIPLLVAPLALLAGCATTSDQPPQPVKIENTEEVRATVEALGTDHTECRLSGQSRRRRPQADARAEGGGHQKQLDIRD